AAWLVKQGKKPMLAACDVQRPAAIDQLEIVGAGVNVPVYTDRSSKVPEDIALAAIKEAERKGCNVVIIDTAGRLQIDEALMDELVQIKKATRPHEILLVVDALAGQDAVNVASGFHDKLGVDGVIMTKLDGDSRGGAALSVKSVTGKPIKFIGVGEKSDALEEFHPDRMASRILGMGDVLTLIEKAQESFDEKKAAELERKMRKNQFTLEDFLDQMGQIKNMGGLGKMLEMMPGYNSAKVSADDLDRSEREFRHMEAIMQSMTPAERKDPSILNASRRQRIAKGAGVTVPQINSLIKKYEEMRKMMKMMNQSPKKLNRILGRFR
ncbi:MAG: signal recognition particle protein, partial [Firmicutes bacterium]|nr:signal recognition particle protein [Bacillota bacterium]